MRLSLPKNFSSLAPQVFAHRAHVLLFRQRLLLISCFLAVPLAASPVPPPLTIPADDDGPWIVRAFGWTDETVSDLAEHFDHLGVFPAKGMLILHLDDRADLDLVLSRGLSLEVDRSQTEILRRLELALAQGEDLSGIPGFECYRTVEETMTDADALAAAHPTLASYIDIGDSWEKTQLGGAPGYDIKVLKLTNSEIAGPKPAALFLGSVHAREYTTAETVTRFGEWMLANYGVDPDVTWVIDHHALHLLLVANPDGRKKAETGLLWRKNTDNDDGCQDPDLWGTDLNRNWDFQWGCCGGSSASPCTPIYRGPGAASEPEIQALQAYMASIFPDQRHPDDLITAADPNAQGLFLDFHSFGRVMLVPWSFFPGGCSGSGSIGCAPDWPRLLSLARKYAFFPGYNAFLGSTGTVDGASKDYSYGLYGVPGYTVELGTTFFEACSQFENVIFPENRPAMLQLAKSVRRSLIEPSGPDILDPSVPPTPFVAGDLVSLVATADDTRFAAPDLDDPPLNPTQNIVSAEVYVDTPWWDGGTPIALASSDGAFDETVEEIGGTLDTTGWLPGRHTLFLRATDASGDFGATSAAFVYIVDPATAPTLQGTVVDGATGDPVGAEITAGVFEVHSDSSTGAFSLQIPAGTYDIEIKAEGFAASSIANLDLADLQVETRFITLSPLIEIFNDDVEGGNRGWVAESPWAISAEVSKSPTRAWTDSAGGNYGNNLDLSLTSPVFDLQGQSGTTLSFSHLYDFEAGWDFAWVEASANGTDWTILASYSQEDQDAEWSDEELAAPNLDGSTTAQFRFRITTDSNTTADGWHLDDIRLHAAKALSDVLFTDGFESADVGAWTFSAP